MTDDILKRKAAAITSFGKIGKSNGSAPPVTTSNSAGIVYEAMIAQALFKVAEARKVAAMAALTELGIIEKEYKPGDYTPYVCDGMAVSIKRNNDSETLDKTMLKNYLTKKYGAVVAGEAISESSKVRKGNTTVTVGVM